MEDLTEFFSKEIIFVCIRFNTNIDICMYNHSPGDVHVKNCVGLFFDGGVGGGGLRETSSKYANENVLLAVVVISQQIDCNGVASSKHLSLLE